MKKLIILLFFYCLASTTLFAQSINRTPFLEIGDKPVAYNQFITENNGGSFYDTRSLYNEERVQEVVKSQKNQGFKKYDKANFLLANKNSLQSEFLMEAGYTYRIFSISELPEGKTILRVKDASGNELAPEIRNQERGSISRHTSLELQLQDIIATENKKIFIENGMMSDRTVYYATTYLIFRKKT